LAVNEFVLRLGELAQGFLASNFKIFVVIREIHKKARVIPRERRLSTTLSTAWSTGRSPGRLAQNWGRISHDPVARCEHPAVRCRQAVVAYRRECRTRSEAPPRMRWRGLAAAIQQGYRLLGYRGYCPVAPPGRENQPGVPVSRLSAHPPRRSGFPVRRSAGVQLISIFGGAEFLPLAAGRRKDFWPGIYEFRRYEQLFHTSGLVIPRAGRLSTGSSTARSTTRRGGGRPQGPVAGGPATGSGSARRTVLRWTDGGPPRDGPRDQAVPRSPGRGSHPGRARCGSWGWR
jgi:hypothetical protein